ncbi:hypothetical protein JCM33374_g937 [Metschnikowia sp. JCM 33374]|nr:hypothetical protein JCM33374_g937 [Metschnikowia sp. JCM 33374]
MSGPTSWWPLSSEPPKPTLPEETHGKLDRETLPPIKEQGSYLSLWPWSAGSASEPQESTESNDAPATEQYGEEPTTWWTSIVGTSSNAVKGVKPPLKHQTISMWLTKRITVAHALDSESDTEDKASFETFREAKSAIDSSKDSCHYAVFKIHGSNDVYLSVHGTSTENSPVKFNERKQPIMPHQHLEKAISDPKPSKSADSAYAESSSRRASQIRSSGDHVSSENVTILKPQPGGPFKPPKTESSRSLYTGPSRSGSVVNGSANVNTTESAIVETASLGRASVASASSEAGYAPNAIGSISPNLDSNFRVITISTKLRLWGEAIIHKDPTSETHIYKSTPPSVERKRKRLAKRALVISVHSFLPTKFVRSVISQSTGSASLIADNAVAAVYRWAAQGGIDNLQVQSIALDGIGTIDARKEKCVRLLENWAAEIKSSDFIFMVSNSTASPVAIQILQHMLKASDFGIDPKKIGFLSMSGALHGPVTGLDAKVIRRAYTYSEYDIIREMFELQKPTSELSKSLVESINELCQFNVKLALVGSVDDQFVPVYSSVCHQTSHPNLFKCLYIDEHAEVPGFVIRLISIILTMENVGYTDHYQLLRDLSELSQGPLTTSASHGDIYKCPDVYDMGVQFALETTSLKSRKDAAFNPSTAHSGETERNLYHLPWNVRGLINDLLHTKHIKSLKLLKDLVSDYRSWDPTARPWREIKQCFAAFEETNPDDLML